MITLYQKFFINEFPLFLLFTGEVWSREKPSAAKFSSDGGITAKITLPNFMGHARYVEQVLVLPFNKYTKSRILSKYQESFLRLVLNCV